MKNDFEGISPDDWLRYFGKFPDLEYITEYVVSLKSQTEFTDEQIIFYMGADWLELLIKFNEEQENYEYCAILHKILNKKSYEKQTSSLS